MQNKKIGLIIGFVAVAIIFFIAGDQYANNKNVTTMAQNTTAGGQMRNGGTKSGRGGNVFGKIVAMDATSITVELESFGGPNGQGGAGAPGTTPSTNTGSKIVFYTGSTQIMKALTGTSTDLVIGKNVSIAGAPNPDGSISANSIQIR